MPPHAPPPTTDDADTLRSSTELETRKQAPGDGFARPDPAEVGPEVGRFRVGDVLGHGGMGTVFEAHDPTLRREVAVKLLHADASADNRHRLQREARALAALAHPHVVQVYDVGTLDDGRLFIAMELVRGEPLHRWQQRARHSLAEILGVYLQAGEGLAAAHAQGLIHRDFKPGNCIRGDDGRVRVLDFGLARALDADEPSTTLTQSTANIEPSSLHEDFTVAGTLLGTLPYMPLEQLLGEPAGPQSDQFAFCVALYEALLGVRPFPSRSVGARKRALVAGEPPRNNPDAAVPLAIRRVLLRGLAREPRERWPSMTVLLDALRRAQRPLWRRPLVQLGLVAVVALGAFGLTAQPGSRRCADAQRHLDDVWDPPRRRAAADSLASMTGTAPDRVLQRLDAYAEGWRRRHAESCAATTLRAEQSTEQLDRHMQCLTRHRLALRETVDVIIRSEVGAVDDAVLLVARLPALSRCSTQPGPNDALPLPQDEALAARVQRLRDQLARTQALLESDNEALATAELAHLMPRIEVLAHDPLTAEALLLRGRAYRGQDELTASENDLRRAYDLATAYGYDVVAGEAALQLASLVGYDQGRFEPGRQWAATALALAQRLDSSIAVETEARAERIYGSVLERAGDHHEALEHTDRARSLLSTLPDPDPQAMAVIYNNLGVVSSDLDRLDDAEGYLQRAIEFNEQALGAEHRHVANPLNNLAKVLVQQGRSDEALPLLQRAVQLMAVDGEDRLAGAAMLNNLGALLYRRGELAEAAPYLERTITVLERHAGPEHPDVARTLRNLGALRQRQGKLAIAEAHLRRSVDILEQVAGPEHPELATSLAALAMIELDQDRLDRSYRRLNRALEIHRTRLGPQHVRTLSTLADLAEVELARGELQTALARAQASREQSKEGSRRYAQTSFVIARVRGAEPEGLPVARAEAQRALEIYRSKPNLVTEAQRVDAWLAAHPLTDRAEPIPQAAPARAALQRTR